VVRTIRPARGKIDQAVREDKDKDKIRGRREIKEEGNDEKQKVVRHKGEEGKTTYP
jgi:hypothetical protein